MPATTYWRAAPITTPCAVTAVGIFMMAVMVWTSMKPTATARFAIQTAKAASRLMVKPSPAVNATRKKTRKTRITIAVIINLCWMKKAASWSLMGSWRFRGLRTVISVSILMIRRKMKNLKPRLWLIRVKAHLRLSKLLNNLPRLCWI